MRDGYTFFYAHLSEKFCIFLYLFLGRINLVDLQQLLNVDFSHIESKASEIIKHEKNRSLVLGQLIDMYVYIYYSITLVKLKVYI